MLSYSFLFILEIYRIFSHIFSFVYFDKLVANTNGVDYQNNFLKSPKNAFFLVSHLIL